MADTRGFSYDEDYLRKRATRDLVMAKRARRGQPSWTRHKFYKDNPQFLGAAKKRGAPIWKMKKPVRPGRAGFRWLDPKYKGRRGPKGWKTEEDRYAKWEKEQARLKRRGK